MKYPMIAHWVNLILTNKRPLNKSGVVLDAKGNKALGLKELKI